MKLKNIGFFKIDIDLSEYFNCEKGGFVVTLREITEDEQLALTNAKAKGEQEQNTLMLQLWKDCLVDWTVEKDDGTKASKKEVIDVISKSASAVTEILTTYFAELPLAKKSAGKSDK